MNHHYYAELENLRIRPLAAEDIEALRQWRNNRQETRFLRDIGQITPEMQKKWFEGYLNRETEMVFAIDVSTPHTHKPTRMVGSLALYDIDRQAASCEIGKIQIGDASAHGKGIGRKVLVMAMKIAFRALRLKKITGCVHQENVQAHTNDLRVGFRIVGEQPSHVGGVEDLIEITEEEAISANAYYRDIGIGDSAVSPHSFFVGQEGRFSKTISESDIYAFAGISGDFNSIHVNEELARKGPFHQRVAHGLLTASLFSTVIGMQMPGVGTICLEHTERFVRPVFIGDTITAYVYIEELKEKNRAVLRTVAYNQNGEMTLNGRAVVLLPT